MGSAPMLGMGALSAPFFAPEFRGYADGRTGSMGDVPSGDTENGHIMPNIDFSGISLDRLAELDDSILINSLNRILGDVDNPDDVVFAGFNASI